MKKRITIIQCSSRSIGHSQLLSEYLLKNENFRFIDLNKKNIGQYRYDDENSGDDFLPTISEMIAESDVLIFVTPIYWYTMSGLMKTFFDRISELLEDEKSLGRKLRGMFLGCMSMSNDRKIDYDFDMPIRKSAEYLGMHYLNHIHCCVENNALTEESKKLVDNYLNVISLLE